MLNSLTSWQYPDISMDAIVLRALASSKAGSDIISHRKRVWEDAFRCLLGAVRSCACNAFYFISASVSSCSWHEGACHESVMLICMTASSFTKARTVVMGN